MSAATFGPGYIGINPDDDTQLVMHFTAEIFPGGDPLPYLERDNEITPTGRSVLGLIGIDFKPYETYETSTGLTVPIDVSGHTELARLAIDDVRELKVDEVGRFKHPHSGENLPFGRLVDETSLTKLTRDETEKAIREKAMAFGDQRDLPDGLKPEFTLNDDGSISLPLSRLEFLINDTRLNTERRLNILLHGRSGIRPYVDTAERDSDESLTGFTLGGVLFSTGPYYWRIRTSLNDPNYEQIKQAAFGDANRIMGIGSHLPPYERHRQVEIIRREDATSDSSNPDNWLKFGDAQITLDLYKHTNPLESQPHPVIIDWSRMSSKERSHLHLNGLNALDAVRATDPALVGAVFDLLNTHDLAASIVTPHGVSGVDVADTDKFEADNIIEAAISFGHSRGYDERLSDLSVLSKLLAETSDRQQVIFANRLIAKYIPKLIETTDIRGLVVKELGDKLSLSREDHAALTTLARRGTTIAWFINDELRELHRSGLWVRTNEIKQMGELEVVIAMYGGHGQAVGNALGSQVDDFISGLMDYFGDDSDKLAIIHGNGPGVMLAAHAAAHNHGVMSIGVGIDVEDVGQGKPNFDPEAFAYFPSEHRGDRQELMDFMRTIPIFNIGGIGTAEEAMISACTDKLLCKLPTPLIFVQNEASIDQAGLYEALRTYTEQLSATTPITLAGKTIDREKHPLVQSWVQNIFHLVDGYDEALATILDFLDDPKAYWEHIGIPMSELELALTRHQATAQTLGLKVDTALTRKASEFIAERSQTAP